MSFDPTKLRVGDYVRWPAKQHNWDKMHNSDGWNYFVVTKLGPDCCWLRTTDGQFRNRNDGLKFERMLEIDYEFDIAGFEAAGMHDRVHELARDGLLSIGNLRLDLAS